MSKKVALMCGHGTQTNGVWDSGCSYAGYTEAALMLPITKAAVKFLRSYGVTVISDSDAGNNRNMISCVAWANREKADAYISIHCDYSKAPSGVYPLYVSTNGKNLASALNNSIKSGMPMKTRGVCRRTDLYELNVTDMPACILETGAIKADLKILKGEYNKYGELIAKGICTYLGIDFKGKPVALSVSLYRVRKEWSKPDTQIGAYQSLVNAKAACDKHAGYSVYDEKGNAVYTSKARSGTKADAIVTQAKKLCWPVGTAEKKWAYATGAALDAYKSALKKHMGKTTKIAQSDCGYFVSTCIRAAGISSTFDCLKWSDPVPASLKVVFKGKKIPAGTLKPGDIVRYKKTSGSQHTLLYLGSGMIAEAGRKIRFPVIRKDTQKYNAGNVQHKTLQVLRAK